MTFLFVLFYFYLIFALGLVVLGRRSTSSFVVASGSFLSGSLILGYSFWALSMSGLINEKSLYFILVLLFIPGSLVLYKSLSWLKDKWRLEKMKFSWELGILLVLLFVYYLDANTPPRAADAMRYHLAQLKDIWNHQGYVVRPYIHYQFPLFFSFLFLPVYAFCGGVGIQLSIFIFLLLFLYLMQRLGYQLGLRKPLLALIVFLCIPIVQLEGTTVTNDLVMMAYVFWGLLLMQERAERAEELQVLAFLSLGMAMWVKYQAVLYIPWYIFLFLRNNGRSRRSYLRLVGMLVLSFLIFSPHMVEHIYHVGNPVYPMLSWLFPSKDLFWQEMAQEYVAGFSGTHHPFNLIVSLKNLFLFNQIPVVYWFLGVLGMWWVFKRQGKKDLFAVVSGISAFFIMWWILQPVYYVRFAVYVLPWAVIFSLLLVQEMKKRWAKRLVALCLLALAVAGLLFFGFYSKDFVRFHWDHDEETHHRATWYYQDWMWINEHLPLSARVLTIELEQTYYLDREHFRAGPPLARSVDWKRMRSNEDFRQHLQELGITHIYYDYGTYKHNPDYAKMNQLILTLVEEGRADLIYQGHPRLYHSRMRNEFHETETWVLEVYPEQVEGR